ncbi:MAG: hypothetical protein IJ539_07910 [Prevotella sp.]|nr:hypothetical protein [Prevotella sp.]MBQ8453684.1 hypothetical protein [Prevotella sp.]
MKKLFTLICFLTTLSLSVLAQDVTFVDKNGNPVADNSCLAITDGEIIGDDEWAYIQLPTGLFIKNNGTSAAYVGISYTIKELPHGAFQICFPLNCVQKDAAGAYSTDPAAIAAGESKDLQSEWIVDELGKYGYCEVEYQLVFYDYEPLTQKYTQKGTGPKVTVGFNYSDETHGVEAISYHSSAAAYYTLDGRQLDSLQKGLNIVKDNNGKTVTVIIIH